ncbi:MAG: type II secretion system protein [Sphingomonadales bacterium 32-68-7]|nr:MAG: type II secretion system protein [Sphingomonadales bacterium 12-68-11]OYX10632.1 MAG: type II secretion system protein [Sphingomonadales bacterium 32-68-7]
MAAFRYRAVDAQGRVSSGAVEAPDQLRAVAEIRRRGVTPIDISAGAADRREASPKTSSKLQAATRRLIGELAVLLNAGLPLDRALALAIENIDDSAARTHFEALLGDVREGMALSQAMAARSWLFPPTAQAMAEAGEANGRLGDALVRLSAALESADELRRLVSTSMIYPGILSALSVGVILLMLLYVVPQFENLFTTAGDRLPASSQVIMGASRALREHGLVMLGAVVAAGIGARHLASRPGARQVLDRFVLTLPQVGTLIRHFETARFARTLGVLLEGEVPLPAALALARRSIANRAISDIVGKVADGVKEGEGLTAPLAATRVFPKIAIGFLRTGEETSRLPLMLGRLADVMDRDVKLRLQRTIAFLTPLITIVLGAAVAGIIASIMVALLGFNDMAIAQ